MRSNPPKPRDAPSQLPEVCINMAMTADGKIATADRSVSTFGSRADHDRLLEIRSTVDAVMCGARTVDSQPIDLGPGPTKFRKRRQQRGLAEHNLRIIVSGTGSVDPASEVFKHRFSPIVILTTARMPKARQVILKKCADSVRGSRGQSIDWRQALLWLKRRWQVNRLVCEGGAMLNDALIRAGVVRLIHLTICPRIVGGRTAPTMVDGSGFEQLRDATRWQLVNRKRRQDEMFLTFRRRP